MFELIQNTILLARTESRVIRRLVRFKATVFVLSICLLASYAISCSVYSHIAPYLPSFVAATPLYLLENVDPVFYLAFQISAMVLAYDIDRRNERNHIAEVLLSKPVSNMQCMAGRVLGCAGLLWIVVAANVLAMQLFGLMSQLSDIDIANTLQVHSIFVLLAVDAPATLIAWCSLTVFLQSAFRSRIVVIAGVLVAAFASYLLLQYVPYSLVDLFSPSSNDTLFISDVIPELPTLPSILMRTGSIAFAAMLIAIAAWTFKRQDVLKVTNVSLYASGFAALGIVSIFFAATQSLYRINEVANWREAHQDVVWERWIDVQTISGQVEIDPEDSLKIDLNIEFKTINTSSERTLLFSFNPGMTISVVELNGLAQNFSFQNGILSVIDTSILALDDVHTLRIIANGVPNPRFAYFDAPLDYVSKSGLPLQVTKSFGVDGLIFRKEYVALMPGSHWYPIPGPVNDRFGDGSSGRDFFELDVQVELSKSFWKLAGPGVSRNEGLKGNSYSLSPTAPVSEFGLFASKFERASTNIHGRNISIYLHERHAKNLKIPEQVRKDMMNWLDKSLNEVSELGLPIVYDSLTLIDVPSRLRTVGGGWRMDSLNSTPGVILLKERGFPVAPIHLAIQRTSRPEDQFLQLLYFFWRGLGTDYVSRSLSEHYWGHATSASAIHAEILDQIMTFLAARLHSQVPPYWFSPYSTMPYVSLTAPSLWQTLSLWIDDSSKYRETLHHLEWRYATRNSVRNDLEITSLADLPTRRGHQRDLELVLLKCNLIADAMFSYHRYDTAKLGAWLSALRQEFEWQNYELEDLIAIAGDYGVSVEPFLTDWLTSSRLPGFVASTGSMTKLEDTDEGRVHQQISFSVRNTESVEGFVVPKFGPRSHTAPIHIEGNSAKRINLVWQDSPLNLGSVDRFYFSLNPGLSLNRYDLNVVVVIKDVTESQQRDRVEHSDWTPEREGIVIDDLDDGFAVLQPKTLPNPLRTNALRGWFQPQTPNLEFGGRLDESEDLYSPKSGRWTRTFYVEAYGSHSRTVAIALADRGGRLPAARFAAQIPSATHWLLEFRVHQPPSEASNFEMSEFKIRVEDATRSWDLDFDPTTEHPLWKTVGEFDLSAGTVHVDVTGAGKRSLVYADAIRWRRVDETAASSTYESDEQ